MTNARTKRVMAYAIAALSLAALPAAAHGNKGPGNGGAGYERLLKHADKNADGKLQTSELPGKMAERFATADANKDGVITKEEFTAAREQAMKAHLAQIDTNKDGKVSPEERTAARQTMAKQRFTRMDKNGDGQIGKGDVGDDKWKRLSTADADKNGSVTFGEFESAISTGKLGHHRKH